MSNDSSAAIREERRSWIAAHRDTYLQSGGTKGHIMDLTAVGGHAFTTHCLIRFKGRKSGKVFITGLIYGDIGGEVVVVASKGGADQHPNWYLNITATREVDIQIATEAFRASWREPVGEERNKIWDFMVDIFPSYASYQKNTERQIPLVVIKPLHQIAVFSEKDVTGIEVDLGVGNR